MPKSRHPRAHRCDVHREGDLRRDTADEHQASHGPRCYAACVTGLNLAVRGSSVPTECPAPVKAAKQSLGKKK